MLDVCLLGTAGTIPLPRRRLSATLVRVGGSLVLLDCGEGTQVALRERGWGLRRLKAILITHAHADHVLGLPGLLLSLGFSGKGAGEPLTVYGLPPVEDVLRGLLVVAPRLPYPLHVVMLSGGETFALEGVEGVQASCAGVEHDVPCLAYSLSVPRAPRFDAERAQALGLPVTEWGRLQRGQSVRFGGRTIEPGEVLGPNRHGLRLVLVTDTTLTPGAVEFVRAGGEGAELLIAEGMYGSEEDKPARWESLHMTFAEAATLARDGGARQAVAHSLWPIPKRPFCPPRSRHRRIPGDGPRPRRPDRDAQLRVAGSKRDRTSRAALMRPVLPASLSSPRASLRSLELVVAP